MPEFIDQELQRILEIPYKNAHPLKTLWRLHAGQRTRLLLAMIFFLIKQSPTWVIPIISGALVTAVTAHLNDPVHNPEGALWHGALIRIAIMGILLAQNIPLHTLYTYFLSRAIRHTQLLIRAALLMRLQQLSISFHDDFMGGRMQSKVLRDVEAIEILMRNLYNALLAALIAATAPIAITIHRGQWDILLFFLVSIPAGSFLVWLFRSRMAENNRVFRTELETMSAQVSEIIEMIPITRAHAAEEKETTRIRRQLQRIRSSGQRLDVTNELFASSTWVTFQAFTFACLLFTIYKAAHRQIPIGDVVMYTGLFTWLLMIVSNITMIYPQLTAGFESMRSIGEILESPDLELNDGKAPVPRVDGRITFDHLTFTYPKADRPAITDFSLDVPPGQCIAIVGESGSGKSTLMNLIIGFRRPTSGRILLDGVDMETLNLRAFRHFLAVVPQQTVLFSGTVRENITYGLDNVKEADLLRVVEMANVKEFASRLPNGLDTPVGPHGGKLSGGQRQRIAIARALLRDPRIIILDEATSSLDVISEQLVQEAINRLIKGRTTFIVAHRLSTIRHADRVVVMHEGQSIEEGSPADLATRQGPFARLKMLQV